MLAWLAAVPFAHAASGEESILPVIFTGSEAAALQGVKAAELSLFSCSDGRIRSIVFQVDEYTADGRIVSNLPLTGPSKDDTPGVIDANDEIVFMERDLGGACLEEQLARAQGKIIELRFSRPDGGPDRLYALVGPFSAVPGTTNLRYERAGDAVHAPGYSWGYSLKKPHIFDRLQFRDYRGGKEDFFDRLKVRMKARSLGDLITIRVNEDDIRGTLEGVRTGPVRIIRHVSISVTPLPGFTISAFVDFIHYERIWDARVRFRLPGHAALFTSSMDVQFVMDFNGLTGVRFVTKTEPQGLPVEGNSAKEPVLVSMGNEPWFLVTGRGLNEMVFVYYDKALSLNPSAYYIDNSELDDAPERVRGCSPCSGFELNRWENLKAQWYSFGAQVLLPPRFPDGGGSGFYQRYQNRPRLKAAVPAN